ncbi:MAG: FimV/HubP family polar landmark protein, partial [Pseudomonadota bacterium]
EQPGATDKSEHWQEIETKLYLAKAYQEMDDKEGAKEMLEEVIRDGDAKQKKAAKKLLKSL